jgi:hypothetical protein
VLDREDILDGWSSLYSDVFFAGDGGHAKSKTITTKLS